MINSGERRDIHVKSQAEVFEYMVRFISDKRLANGVYTEVHLVDGKYYLAPQAGEDRQIIGTSLATLSGSHSLFTHTFGPSTFSNSLVDKNGVAFVESEIPRFSYETMVGKGVLKKNLTSNFEFYLLRTTTTKESVKKNIFNSLLEFAKELKMKIFQGKNFNLLQDSSKSKEFVGFQYTLSAYDVEVKWDFLSKQHKHIADSGYAGGYITHIEFDEYHENDSLDRVELSAKLSGFMVEDERAFGHSGILQLLETFDLSPEKIWPKNPYDVRMHLAIGEIGFEMEIDLTKFPIDGESGNMYQVYLRFYMKNFEDYKKIENIGCALHYQIFEEIFGSKFQFESSASFNTTIFFENAKSIDILREFPLKEGSEIFYDEFIEFYSGFK